MRLVLRMVAAGAMLTAAPFTAAQSGPPEPVQPGGIAVKLTELTRGLGGPQQIVPTDLVPRPDGSGVMAVATINGLVRLIIHDGGYLDSEATPFLDTRNEPYRLVPSNFAFGMTGITFHPDYAKEGHAGFGKFFTILTETNQANGNPHQPDLPHGQEPRSGAHQDVLVEWSTDHPSSSTPSWTRRDVLRFDQPQQNHNVTDLAFGPDGLLYLSAGDGGGPTRLREVASQNPTNFLGSVMRIDPLDPEQLGIRSVDASLDLRRSTTTGSVRYRVPFGDVGNPGAGLEGELDEIFAIGLRSPFRINFDRLTGELYAGDVGQSRREEIDRVERGANYGWGRFEGTRLHRPNLPLYDGDSHQEPILEYTRSDGDTVIGGFVYRGSLIPELSGKYVFADFGRQIVASQAGTPARLFYGDLNTGHISEFLLDPRGELLADVDDRGELTSRQFILSIGEDANGELYLVVGDDPQVPTAIDAAGRILRLTPGNKLSTVSVASFDPSVGVAAESIVSGFANDLAVSTGVADTIPPPTELAGVRVKVVDATGNELLAPLFFVSALQINYLIPEGTGTGTATVTVCLGGKDVAVGRLQVDEVAPGLFAANANGQGVAAATVQRVSTDGSQTQFLVFTDDPPGSRAPVTIGFGADTDRVFVNLFGTGIRAAGEGEVGVTIGGQEVTVTFVGAHSVFAGLDVVQIGPLPRELEGRGETDTVLTARGKQANTVTLAF